MRRKPDLLHQLVRREPPVHATDGLVVHVLDRVAVGGQDLRDLFGARYRPGVAGRHVLRLQSPHLVEAPRPLENIAIQRPADGVEVGKSLVDIVPRHQDPLLGKPNEDLIVGLSRSMDELELHPAELELQLVAEGPCGTNQPYRAAPAADLEIGTDPGIDHPVVPFTGQVGAEHPRASPRKHRPDDVDEPVDVELRALVRDYFDVAVRDEALATEDVIRVIVGVDERADRLGRDLLERSPHGTGALDTAHPVHHHDALVALDQDRVGETESDRLMDAVGDLVDLLLELRGVGGELRMHGVVGQ